MMFAILFPMNDDLLEHPKLYIDIICAVHFAAGTTFLSIGF